MSEKQKVSWPRPIVAVAETNQVVHVDDWCRSQYMADGSWFAINNWHDMDADVFTFGAEQDIWVQTLKSILQAYIEGLMQVVGDYMVEASETLNWFKKNYGDGEKVTDWDKLVNDEWERIEKELIRQLNNENHHFPGSAPNVPEHPAPGSVSFMLSTWRGLIELT